MLGNRPGLALVLWLANRCGPANSVFPVFTIDQCLHILCVLSVLDGLDGSVARRFNKQTDLGGYLDILCDFIVYALVPIGVTLGRPAAFQSDAGWVTLALLEGVYFVNAAGLFQLAAILERHQVGFEVNVGGHTWEPWYESTSVKVLTIFSIYTVGRKARA